MRCGWAKRTSSPIAGPGRVHAPVPPTIKGPNRPTCSVRSAPNAEPAPPSCCRPATPKLCSFTSMRSQPKSLRALTLFSSSIKPAGMAPRPSRFQTTSRSCSSRHAHPNSTAKKISGNSCGRTGCRTEFSNLRRYRRSLLLRLEHAHRSAVENHVHRPPRLGSRRSLNLRIGIRSLRHDAAHSLRRDKLPLVASTGGPGRLDDPLTRTVDAVTEQKYPVLLEYAKASFERIKQRLRHLRVLARVKRVLNDCTLV